MLFATTTANDHIFFFGFNQQNYFSAYATNLVHKSSAPRRIIKYMLCIDIIIYDKSKKHYCIFLLNHMKQNTFSHSKSSFG